MKDIDMHLRYFDYLYKQGIIKKDTHAQVTRDILADRRKLVSIKSVFDDNYVSIDGESNILYTHTDKFGISERLYFINLGNGSALLQSYDGYYVRANPSNNVLVASEVESSNATVFTLIPISQKEVALKTDKGNFVQVSERDNILVANATMQSNRTSFKIKEITQLEYDDIVMISISEQLFVTATDGGGSSLTATKFDQTDNEEFTIIDFLDKTIAIKTHEDYYVRVRDDNNALWADVKDINDATRFTGENLGNSIIVLKTLDGKVVRVRQMDKLLVAEGTTVDDTSKFNIYESTRPNLN